MIFTLYYMYATLIQWWRLGALRNKINGTLNTQNALLVCDQNVVFDAKKLRSFETLLFHFEDRLGCTVVPKQKINLSQWLGFPRDSKYFPIHFNTKFPRIESPNIYILVQAMLETYVKHSASLLPVEQFGELIAWRATDHFEAIVKTDIDKLTKLVHCFSQSTLDINHELKLLKIESVDIEGNAAKIKYERQFSNETTLKYSCAPVHWKSFVDNIKEIYGKIFEVNRKPTITIENGKSEEKVVPVNQVRPIKKENRKSDEKNNLEVVAVDYRRHKSTEHKREKSTDKHKADHTKNDNAIRKEPQIRDDGKNEEKRVEDKSKRHTSHSGSRTKKKTDDEGWEGGRNKPTISKDDHISKEQNNEKKERNILHEKLEKKELKKSSSSHKPESRPKRTSSSDKKLVKSVAICDETDTDPKDNTTLDRLKLKSKDGPNKKSFSGNGNQFVNFLNVDRYHITKPPNILVYADSFVAKENVKAALASILNREKYIIYDLPLDTDKIFWGDSAALVVVCGTVQPNLTYHLLQYLINGGQLLCLCSDLLNSVLHTFTTAEVREHELVRFSYGKWNQVKMMHHIFCYQASPAKKQFSKDSDHSNQSSNGSSPVAPRTPSAVELSHNGKDYIIQVQVLGTEETWQTPSLLLATVKEGSGRAIFSQVHLEINPSQYEDDENKFEALKDSDQARLEILKDLLANHLELDCMNNDRLPYLPGYFLGRHEMKMKLLNECESIKNKTIEGEKLSIKFCGKDENTDVASVSMLPVHIHSCPTNFSTVNYFEALATEHIGRLVIYCDIVSSSQHVIVKKLTHGLVVIPRQQTHSQGRSNNVWLSPIGCACFSLQLHIPLNSPLGKTLPIIQHLVMVSVVSAFKEKGGCKELDIGIKWPNDLYVNKNTKIGGILVNSQLTEDVAIVNIGCGIDLDNEHPTVSINGLIRKINESQATAMKNIPYEVYFASVFNEIERLYNAIQKGEVAEFYEQYYKYWLHSNSKVNVTTHDGNSELVKIVGIDEFGFLRVKSKDGTTSRVQPDGNSFDMMKGLILPKYF